MKKLVILFLLFAVPVSAQTARQYYNTALKTADTQEQIKLYTKAIDKSPKFILAYHRRADAYKQSGQYKRALNDYSKIIKLDPNDPFKYYARALANLELLNYSSAENDLTKAIKLKSNYEDFYYHRALCYLKTNKARSAILDLNKVKSAKHTNEVLFLRAKANYQLYNYNKAEILFKELVKKDSQNEEALIYLARISINREMYDEAIALLSRVLNQNANNESAISARAFALKEISLFEEAAKDYTTLISIRPTFLNYNRRGIIYEQLEDWDKAISDFSEAIKLNSKWSIAYNNRGYAKMKIKDYKAAKSDFENALKYEPPSPTAAINYAGYFWTVKKDKKNMYKYLDKALKYNFKDTSVLYDESKKGWLFKNINNTVDFRTFIEGGVS